MRTEAGGRLEGREGRSRRPCIDGKEVGLVLEGEIGLEAL